MRPEAPRPADRASTTPTADAGRVALLAVGVAAGVGLAYLDSLPTWDDSGILASGLLLASGALTLAGFRPAWLAALATGIWIPAHAIASGGDLRMAVVLIFAMAGAYAGMLIRAGFESPKNSQ